MSTSVAQVAANRANAQQSTGPRTEEGQQRSSQNATTHGLFITEAQLNEREAFRAYHKTFIADLQPEGALEKELVYTIASLSMRLSHCIALEFELLEKSYDDPEKRLAALDRFSRYEHRFRRAIRNDLKELKERQAARKEQAARELEAAIAIARDFKKRNQPYDPTEDGFVFSAAELAPYVSRRERLEQCSQTLTARPDRKSNRAPVAEAA